MACRPGWIELVGCRRKRSVYQNTINCFIYRAVVSVIFVYDVAACNFSGGNTVSVNEHTIQAENHFPYFFLTGEYLFQARDMGGVNL